MKYLSLEEILIIHEYQIEKFGGEPGVRDVRLLESAVFRLQATFDGIDLYQSVFEKAVVLLFSLIKNHPFADGNKRTALHSMLVYLEQNGVLISITDKELVALGIEVASNTISENDVIKRLERERAKRP